MNSNIIYEFDFDIAINKLGYKNKDTFSIHETKLFLLYTLGKKLKKSEIIRSIKKIRDGNDNIIFIKKEELKLLKEMNEKDISNNEYIEALCNYIINNDNYTKTISLELFRNRLNEIMPNLSKGILNQVFYYLSGNNNVIIIDQLKNKRNNINISSNINIIK